MGPLVPDIIGNELNMVVALFIGVAFGYILEQAGFSSSKKLVGLFYGYDFTVLRVFFTAGVTAMIGIVIFSHYGLIDMDIVYVNPTFLYSALIGGGIMGLGFVIGGFCPGTSVCAASIGKKDGMYFILGSAIGVFLFTELYPLFREIYIAENWGYVRIFDTLGMSQGLFAFLLTLVAVGAFWATTAVEHKVNGRPVPKINPKSIYVGLTAVALFFGLSAFFMPPMKTEIKEKIKNQDYLAAHQVDKIDTEELAIRLMRGDDRLQIFDLREKAEYDSLALPNSVNVALYDLFDKSFNKILSLRGKENIFIAGTESEAKKAALLVKELGYENARILKGGMISFENNILNFEAPVQLPENKLEKDKARFRLEAKKVLPELIAEFKLNNSNKAKPKKSKRVIGGC